MKVKNYELFVRRQDTEQTIDMPLGAELLGTGYGLTGHLVLRALVDDKATPTKRRFLFVETNQESALLDKDIDYIDTIELGLFTWHLFERL